MIRVGVIGTAGVGTAHVEALRAIPNIAVTAIAGSTPASARASAQRLGVSDAFASGPELIASGLVDSVHICSPDDVHAESIRAAVVAGIPIVCEKPVAARADEALALAELVDTHTAPVTVCYTYRYAALIADIVRLVREGQLGTVHTARATYLQNWQLSAAHGWRNDASRTGPSRVMADIGTHLIDLVEVTVGSSIVALTGEASTLQDRAPSPHDSVATLARFRNGALGALAVSQIAPGHMNTLAIELDGDRASLCWRLGDRETMTLVRAEDSAPLRLDRHADPRTAGTFWSVKPDAHARLGRLLTAFYLPLLGRETEVDTELAPLPDFRDGARHVDLIATTAGIASPASEEKTAG